MGRSSDALGNYQTAAASQDRRAAAQGRLREILLRHVIGHMPRNDVIAALETLTTIWRGGETEEDLAGDVFADGAARAVRGSMRSTR